MDRPELRRIINVPERSKAVIFIHGGWSEASDRIKNYRQWALAIQMAGWKGSIYHLWWDSLNSPNPIKCFLDWDELRSRAKQQFSVWQFS